VLYSSLINTNLYLRRLLNYDHTLFFPVGTMVTIVSAGKRPTASLRAGAGRSQLFSVTGLFYSASAAGGKGRAAIGSPSRCCVAKLRPAFGKVGAALLAILVSSELLFQAADASHFTSD
jgi:hypothetical protein